MSDLGELAKEFSRRGSQPAKCSDLARMLRGLIQIAEATRDDRKFIEQLQARLLIVDVLPLEAPLGALIRRRNGTLAERATLYMGNGPGQPITKLAVPTA